MTFMKTATKKTTKKGPKKFLPKKLQVDALVAAAALYYRWK